MSHDLVQTRVANLGSFTINAPNTIAFAPGTKIRAKRVILAYTTGNTTLGNVLTNQRRPLAGVAASQVTLFTCTSTPTTVAGDIDYYDLGVANPAGVSVAGTSDGGPTSTTFTPNAENYPVIWPGQDFAIVTDGAGAAGVCTVYLEYEELPFVAQEVENYSTTLSVRKLTTS